MAAYRKTEITIETQRVVTIRRRRVPRAWCAECGGDVDMVNLVEVQALTELQHPVLRDSAEAQKWHFCVGPDGTTLVCLESLLKSL